MQAFMTDATDRISMLSLERPPEQAVNNPCRQKTAEDLNDTDELPG
jgi:hypothetical protein